MNIDLHLSVSTFLGLMQVFKNNGWEIPDRDAGYESRFNRFCERLSLLDAEEQDLVLELTSHFKVINGNDYLQILLKLLNDLHERHLALFQQTKKFFVLPLVAPQDLNKTKSSSFVWYYFRDEHIKYSPIFIEKKLIFCDMAKVEWIKNLKPAEAVILLDDYIGSGETAVDAVNWIVENYSINPAQIIVLSIAAQEIGIQNLVNNTSVSVYSYYNYRRGISDNYTGNQLDTYTKLMTNIEDKLNVSDEYKFGYNQSEALISLIRTPNNTFPVFWKPCGENRNVPFPRD